MPVRLCLEETCPNPATQNGRCATHAAAQGAVQRAVVRPIYKTKRWRILRRRVLFDEPICRGCQDALATEVDHVVALEDGGAPYARSNVQPLCGPCHGRKTWEERNARTSAREAAG